MSDMTLMVAMDSRVVAQDLIDPFIPEFLRTAPQQQTLDGCHYWRVEDLIYELVKGELDALFGYLDKLQLLNKRREHELHMFGAIYVGCNPSEVQIWGYPSQFDMYWEFDIVSPMDQGIT